MGTPLPGKRSSPCTQEPTWRQIGNVPATRRTVNRAMDPSGTARTSLPATGTAGVPAGAPAPPHGYRSLRLQVESEDTAQAAREVTALTLRAWYLSDLVPDVQLCVSELVGNVRLHAVADDCFAWDGEPRTLTVTWRRWPSWLLVDVADGDSTAPMLPLSEMFGPDLAEDLPEAMLPTHGRGLHIVRALADFVWWAPRDDGGKSVFCRFDLSRWSA